MPLELYALQKAEDGTESYVKVDALPEEVVKEHPEYKRVATLKEQAVAESKERLRRAQEAENLLKEKPQTDDKPQAPTQVQTPTPQINEEELTARLYAKIKAEMATESEAKKTADLETENLIRQHRLQDVDNIRDILAQAGTAKAVLADSIGRGLKKFAPIDGGEVSVDSPDFMKGVYNRLGLPNK